MPSPFIYEHPVAPEDVIDRKAETAELVNLAKDGRFVRLVAPRRYGKTSLLGKLFSVLDAEAVPHVLVDFYGVVSVADVTHRIERAYADQLQGRVRAAAERFLNAAGLGLSLGAFGFSASLQRSSITDPAAALQTLLDLPLSVLAKTGSIPLVVFDEFQDILPVARVDAVIRSRIQHHGGRVAYVFSGSEPGMMRELFGQRSRPLYGQAVSMRLGRLPDGELAEYIHDRFAQTGKSAGDTLGGCLAVAAGHPQRSMLLAHHLWEATSARGEANAETWLRALSHAEAEVRDEFQAAWRGLDTGEQRALRALAASVDEPYDQDSLRSVDLKKSTARGAYQRLEERGDLEREGDLLRYVDPLFERWVAARATG